MILAGPESGVIKIGCCAHPRVLGAKRLLQHNLFNGGSLGRMCVASEWKVACHSGIMIERSSVNSPSTLMWECEVRTRSQLLKIAFFFFLYVREPPPPPTHSNPICHLIQLYVLSRKLSLTLGK